MKTRFALLIAMALLAVGLPAPAHAATPFTFDVSAGGEATITGYNGTVPTELDIPDEITDDNGTYTVTAIGTYAFDNNGLTELTLPGTLTTISGYAFYNNQLIELILPNSLTTLGEAAFGINQLADLTLPDTITTISNHAFYNNQLTDVTLPNTITTIGTWAFHENRLTELDLPSAITTIGTYAFYGNELTDLTLPNTITTIGDWAFATNQLTDLTIPSALTTISDGAFYGNQLADLTLPGTLTTIGNYAFRHNQLTELAVPASVTSIGQNAFAGNSRLGDVRFTGTAPQLGNDALGTSDPTVRFPWKFGDPRTADGYTTPIWNGYDTTAVADVTFAAGDDITIQAVDVGAATAEPVGPGRAGQIFTGWFADLATTPFDFSTAITGDITLTAGYEAGTAPVLTGPATATVQLGGAFAWAPTTLTGDPAPSVTATGLPDGLEIDNETGAISGTVTNAALAGDHDVTITATNDIDPDATLDLTISIEGFTYSIADDQATITGYHGTAPTELVIPAEIADDNGTYPVTAIGDGAFTSNQLTDLTLPNNLTTIGTWAFNDNQLTELTLPNNLTTISDYAFVDNQLTELTLPGTLTTIGNWAFGNNKLTELTLPDTLTTIGDYAFYINRLTELTLPDTLTTISEGAFGSNQLTELTLPGTLTTIGANAFAYNQLTDPTLPSTLTTISDYAFAHNKLTDLTLPGALTTIGQGAFANNKLTDLTLPGALTTISHFAFEDNQLTELTVPASVASIGQGSFADNPDLDDVRFTGIAPELGDDALGTNDPTVRFPWKLGDSRTAGGYTTPTWNGYTTIAVADVTFTGGGDIDTQSVDVDDTAVATKPADPVKDGHVFTGWYAGDATTPFDFTKPITGDVVLTAGFELSTVPAPTVPTVPTVPTSPADPATNGLNPAIAGNPREGKTLTAKPRKLNRSGATATYQWRANGKAIKGATKPSLKLRKAQAGKRITVTITVKATGARSVSKTSAKTRLVSSAKRRLVLSTYTVGKNKPVTVTATGLKARQKIIIWLAGDKRYVGRADSRGVLSKTVTFANDIRPGTRRVRVSGYQANGDRNGTIRTTVRYR